MIVGEGISSDSWVVELESRQKAYDSSRYLSKERAKSIYRFPHDLVEIAANSNKNIYTTPRMVSFGPYHHAKKHLKPMQLHKERALHRIIERKKKNQLSVALLAESLMRVQQELVDSYDDLNVSAEIDSSLSLEAFLEMMLLDGCFMLEVLRFNPAGDHSDDEPVDATADPLFSKHGACQTFNFVFGDMLLLENQIPLLCLKALLEAESGTGDESDGYETNKFIDQLFIEFFGFRWCSPSPVLSLHPLDVYRRCFLQETSWGAVRPDQIPIHPSRTIVRWVATSFRNLCRKIIFCSVPSHKEEATEIGSPGQYMRSAKRLHDAGVTFRRSEPGKGGLVVEFDDKEGVLTLPLVHLDDLSPAIYMNMMAFERCHPASGNEISSFVSFMDNLIDTPEDVSILSSKGIVLHVLGSDEAAASVFNTLSEGIVVRRGDVLREVLERVMRYTAHGWHAWRADLVQTYFTNPWSCLSLFAATLLMVLTVTQTVYAVRSYAKTP